jgi:hypothetical protein
MNGQFFVNPIHKLNGSTSVAIRIINNPNISNIIITDDFYKYEEDYINFNWKKYIELNNDLNHVKNKLEAWEHWINHGKNEGRKCSLEEIETKIETKIETIDKNIENEKNMFDWKKYIEINNDLNHIKNKEEAWEHWINHGKNEGRNFYIKSKYNTFDWKYYVQINSDLSHITTEEEALKHWNEFGKKEGRSFSTKNFLFSNSLTNFNKIS